jgi:D-glycero-D-manno-heptose 1,7-bisphosphate phosphatase
MLEQTSASRFKRGACAACPSVGDSLRDLQAGFISGCLPYLVLTGKGQKTHETGGLPPGTQVFPDLASMVNAFLKNAASPAPATVASPA